MARSDVRIESDSAGPWKLFRIPPRRLIPEGSRPAATNGVVCTASPTHMAVLVGGGQSTVVATFSQAIPAAPVLTSPADGATDVDPNNLVVSWEPVATDLDGDPRITIVGCQVIVELDEEPEFPEGFAQPVFSIYLPATATSVTVPSEFMTGGASYEYEVLAIEESGNQTISSAEFTTQ